MQSKHSNLFRFVISRAILLFFQCHRIIKKYPTEHFPKKCFSICGSRRSIPQVSIHITRHCETTLLKQKDLINAADTVIARCHLDCHMVQYHLYGHMSHWQNLNIIELAMCVRVCVSHVLDSQLLNGWTYGHENCRVCSCTRSHDSVIFSYFLD